jgi:UDP-N-acetylmuramate dehydrogenase
VDLLARLRGLGISGSVEGGVPLAGLTSYGIGGPAEVLVEIASVDDALRVLGEARRLGAPVTVLGAGSNVLVPDEGIAGLTLRVAGRVSGVSVDGGVLTVAAGSSDRQLASSAAQAGITGFEFLEDIPGSVGGGLVQNAEAWGDAISDHLVEVTAAGLDGTLRTLRRPAIEFGYRTSTFKTAGDLVVLEARFAPPGRDDPARIAGRMDELRAKRHERYPLDLPSCGSVFKRPTGDYPGRLIEKAGLGGLRVGGACVSTKHHNFIVNVGGASARDVRTLVGMVRERVLETSGIALERELVYLGPGGDGTQSL